MQLLTAANDRPSLQDSSYNEADCLIEKTTVTLTASRKTPQVVLILPRYHNKRCRNQHMYIYLRVFFFSFYDFTKEGFQKEIRAFSASFPTAAANISTFRERVLHGIMGVGIFPCPAKSSCIQTLHPKSTLLTKGSFIFI